MTKGASKAGRWNRRVAIAAPLSFALLAGGAAHAAPDAPPTAASAKKLEDAGRAKAADEIARLAKYCALTNAFDDARRDYAKALAFVAGNAAIQAELAKIKGRTAKPSKAVTAGIVERRTKALVKCVEYLTPAATAYAKQDRSDELGSLLQLMRAQALPVDELMKTLEIVVYEPYLDWRTKSAVEKLEAGFEYIDGAWLDPEKIAAMDAAHSTWEKRWIFSDEVHEIHTTLPRRTAKQVLAHVGAYRRFFLDYFTGEWDLVAPKKKLPVIVTKTRAEMEQRTKETPNAPPPPPNASAWYLSGPGEGNPCFVSYEANAEGGTQSLLDFDGLRRTFEHELGHQIGFEYSKHAEGRESHQSFKWVVEGLAEFLPNYDLVDGTWTLTHPAWHTNPEGVFESAFGWCHENAERLPTLSIFFEQAPERFNARSYHIAAALVAYLLEGNDRVYRPRFIDLAETVHRSRATAKSQAACFEGVDLDTLGRELRDWCAEMKLDRR